MSKPVRIQRKRIKGWKLPPNTVSVTRPGKWGNPYRVGIDGTAQQCVNRFQTRVESNLWSFPTEADIKRELRGKNLACFCALCAAHKDGKPFDLKCADCTPCHSDVLGPIANAPEPPSRHTQAESGR